MLFGAFTSGILTMINEYRLREFLFWMVGASISVVGTMFNGGWTYHDRQCYLMMLGRHLNVLVLGDTGARALGVPVMS